MATSVSTGSTLANVADIVFANAREDPGRPAVRGPLADPRLVLTRADLAALTARRAAQWADELSPGERIVLICPTTAEFVVEFFGAQAAGLVVVPVNPLSTQRELAHFIGDSGAAHVVAHPACNSAGRGAAQTAGVAYSDIELFDPTRRYAVTPPVWSGVAGRGLSHKESWVTGHEAPCPAYPTFVGGPGCLQSVQA